MDMTHAYWDDTNIHQRVKYEGCNSNDELNNRTKDERPVFQCCDTNLNFSTATCSEDDSEYSSFKKNKVTRQDPMSHRIIEKRRRDRMNNCLADLSRLIPTDYLKKGRGRIEKTEIIEMAIKYMKCLQHEHATPSEHYRMGYQECMSETMRFMVEVEGHFPREGICLRILSHLQKHCESISRMAQHPSSTTSPPLEAHCADPASAQAPGLNSSQSTDYQPTTTTKPEPNNNHGFEHRIKEDDDIVYEKQSAECNGNGLSYKYKTNIKMRFSQDLNEGIKRQKMGAMGRRGSLASIDNQSSSHSSPPRSEQMRASEAVHEHCRVSPSQESTASLKIEAAGVSYSPPALLLKNTMHHHHHENKTNFNVPIFVLHAKGAFYIPLSIEYKALVPYLRNCDIIDFMPNSHDLVLHPVTINVNYHQPVNTKYKTEFNNNNWN